MTNETTASSLDWKEIGITALITLVCGTVATVAGLYIYDGLKAAKDKKAKEKEKEK
jgi:hypothetical protein